LVIIPYITIKYSNININKVKTYTIRRLIHIQFNCDNNLPGRYSFEDRMLSSIPPVLPTLKQPGLIAPTCKTSTPQHKMIPIMVQTCVGNTAEANSKFFLPDPNVLVVSATVWRQ